MLKSLKTITAQSGHTMAIFGSQNVCDVAGFPGESHKYSHFYEVHNFDSSGVLFFYMAKGYRMGNISAPNEIHVWYRNGKMWSGFGTNFKTAIDGAQRDGWMHAD